MLLLYVRNKNNPGLVVGPSRLEVSQLIDTEWGGDLHYISTEAIVTSPISGSFEFLWDHAAILARLVHYPSTEWNYELEMVEFRQNMGLPIQHLNDLITAMYPTMRQISFNGTTSTSFQAELSDYSKWDGEDYTISGKIVEEGTTTGVQGIAVRAFYYNNPPTIGSMVDSDSTDVNGNYSLTVSGGYDYIVALTYSSPLSNVYWGSSTSDTNKVYNSITSDQTLNWSATYEQSCLTISVVNNIGGTISSNECAAVPNATNNTCAYDYDEGTSVSLIATPDSDLWTVTQWICSVPSAITVAPDKRSATVVMPAQDVTVQVEYYQAPITLELEVNGGVGGCIQVTSPITSSCIETSGAVQLPTGTGDVQIRGDYDTGYRVQKWQIDGSDYAAGGTNEYITFDADNGDPVRQVKVFFEVYTCPEKHLEITIVGNGSVNPGTGDYCEDDILNLNPVPQSGWRFSHWEHNYSLTQSGITLIVPMVMDREITAVFVEDPIGTPTAPAGTTGYVAGDANVFYCPSKTRRSNVISFTFENTIDVSAGTRFHFSATFYSDATKETIVYSVFSLADQRRWYYDDGSFHDMPARGLEVDYGDQITVVFDPEIAPASSYQSREHFDDTQVADTPLLCGMDYYVDVRVYDTTGDTGSNNYLLQTISLHLACDDVDGYYWDVDREKRKWICSGQGGTDLKVSDSSEQSLFPRVSSSMFEHFTIVWQAKRDTNNLIYGANWNSQEDRLSSSGQGYYDTLFLSRGFKPLILTDHAGNFYVAAQEKTKIVYYACPMLVAATDDDGDDPGGTIARYCYPGQTTFLDTSYGDIKVRVYEPDQHSSLVVNENNVVPIVTKQNIRLDIAGLQGAYAVRVRDSESLEWTDWLSIDKELHDEQSDNINAYKISNDRFIVPWLLPRVNGLRRICCQILTLYGISRTFCLDVFLNQDIVEYVFEFYTQSDFTGPVPTHNGYQLLTGTEEGSTIYFKVIFSEDILSGTAGNYTYNGESVTDDSFRFNMIQQGIDDSWDQPLKITDAKTLWGEIKIYKHDGIFNKDGQGFIQVIFPDDIASSACRSDRTDAYNLLISNVDAEKYQDSKPEDVFQEEKTDKAGKLLNPETFKQYYKQDDENFRFGNPRYFRND